MRMYRIVLDGEGSTSVLNKQSRLLPKLATESTVAEAVNFVAGFGDKSATT